MTQADMIKALLAVLGIASIAMLIFAGRKKGFTDRGEAQTSRGGKPFFFRYVPPSRNNSGFSTLSIEAFFPFAFRLEREQWGQKLASVLGFTCRFRTQDNEFDSKVYISSDDSEFCDRLHDVSALRRVLLDIFQRGANYMEATPGSLTIRLLKAQSLESLGDDTANAMVEDLYTFKRQFPESLAYSDRQHPNLLRSKIFQHTFLALLLIGVPAAFIQTHDLLYPAQVFRPALNIAIAGWIFALAIIWTVFNKSTLGYDVLRMFLLSGIAGIAVCSYALCYHANILADRSPAETHDQRFLRKYITYGGKHNNIEYYHLSVGDWHETGTSLNLNVSQAVFNRAYPGYRVRVKTHPGRLGFEWIENYELVP